MPVYLVAFSHFCFVHLCHTQESTCLMWLSHDALVFCPRVTMLHEWLSNQKRYCHPKMHAPCGLQAVCAVMLSFGMSNCSPQTVSILGLFLEFLMQTILQMVTHAQLS